MADEAIECVAAFFRTMGKDVATAKEFTMKTSLDLKWMSPSESEALLSGLVSAGYLESRNGYVRPAVPVEGVEVPIGYRPAKGLAERLKGMRAPSPKADAPVPEAPRPQGPAKDVFRSMMESAVAAGIARKDFISECNRLQKRLDIDISVAALAVLRDAGVDISGFTGDVREHVASM